MKQYLLSLASGILFSIGLVISGMINPQKVRGFLDLFGQWDFSLAFVMLGAIGFNFFAFKIITKKKPLCSNQHYLPTNTVIDKRLISGAILFGLGWGILGICPGPGIVNLVTLNPKALLFVFSMTGGMGLFKFMQKANIL